MKRKQEFVTLATSVWRGRNDGSHGWMRCGADSNHYLTIEPMEEDGTVYLTVALVDDVDALGYPMTEYIAYLDVEEGFTAESLESDYDYLMGNLTAHVERRMAAIKAHLAAAIDLARKEGRAVVMDGVELLGAPAIREYALFEVPDDEVQLSVSGDWYLTGLEIDSVDSAYGYLEDYLDGIAERLAS